MMRIAHEHREGAVQLKCASVWIVDKGRESLERSRKLVTVDKLAYVRLTEFEHDSSLGRSRGRFGTPRAACL